MKKIGYVSLLLLLILIGCSKKENNEFRKNKHQKSEVGYLWEKKLHTKENFNNIESKGYLYILKERIFFVVSKKDTINKNDLKKLLFNNQILISTENNKNKNGSIWELKLSDKAIQDKLKSGDHVSIKVLAPTYSSSVYIESLFNLASPETSKTVVYELIYLKK